MILATGLRFEFHSAPMGTVTEYELESSEDDLAGLAGWSRLRNVETDGIARVLNKALRSRDGWPSESYWQRVES